MDTAYFCPDCEQIQVPRPTVSYDKRCPICNTALQSVCIVSDTDVDTLQARIAELEQDKKRIDWLTGLNRHHTFYQVTGRHVQIREGLPAVKHDGPDGWYFEDYEDLELEAHGPYPTARAAIDAAMEASDER